jgi:DNA-binding SARP family transcriptional activator/tetratricopeptide (TPR) repeat protein/DNA-binding XRE family transcriptional regulator
MLRVGTGLTQEELGRRAGITARSIRDIEHGRAQPRTSSLRRLAEALDLSAADTARLLTSDRTGPPRPSLTITVLGPLSAARSGTPITMTSHAQRTVLALLALESDYPVSPSQIAQVLWGDQPPVSWRNRIQVVVSELRDRLGYEDGVTAIAGDSSGYRLQAAVDATDFRQLLDAAAKSTNDTEALPRYETAFALWRGDPFSGLESRLSGRPVVAALHRGRLLAALAYADIALATRQAARCVPRLAQIIEQEPLHEGLHARYMSALADIGGRDQALEVYHTLRRRLSDELGVHPGEELQAAYQSILHAGSAGRTPAVRVPAQLPMAPPVFGGREDDVDLLIGHLLRPVADNEIAAPRIMVLHGMPGVGKSTLALRVAHAIRRHYPDGQLFADLRGEAEYPADPFIVLAALLRALGVAPAQIPDSEADRSSLLRTCLRDRRMLLVLDDARSVGQILPLLPATAGNDVIITSRDQLAELPVTKLAVSPLDVEGSVEVLTAYLPQEDHESAIQLAQYCGGLPLALQIVAGRITGGERPGDVVDGLHASESRLGQLTVGRLTVPATLESAYSRLSPGAQAAFRRLTSLPTTTIPLWTVDIVLGSESHDSRRVMRELSERHLISPVGAPEHGHHRFHDLVRLYGRSLASDDDHAARDQAILHWLHTAEYAAAKQTARRLGIEPLQIEAPLRQITPPVDAGTWLTAEQRNLLDLIEFCAGTDRPHWAAAILNGLSFQLRAAYLRDEGHHYTDLVLQAAERLKAPLAHAYALESQVRLAMMEGTYTQAMPGAERAIEIFTAARVPAGRALMQYHLQYLFRRANYTGIPPGPATEVVPILQSIIAAFADHRDVSLLAAAHQALGVVHHEYFRDDAMAVGQFEKALALADPTTREHGQISFSLAKAYVRTGRFEEAEELLVPVLRGARSRNDYNGVCVTLAKLGEIRDEPRAGQALDEADEIADAAASHYLRGTVFRSRSRIAERKGDIVGAIRATEAALRHFETGEAPQEIQSARRQIARLKALLPHSQNESETPERP